MIETLRYILLLARLAVVQHQAEAVALVARTLLGAVGDVAAIGRIERRRVAGGIVGGDVLGFGQNLCHVVIWLSGARFARGADECVRPYIDRDDPEIVVGGSGLILVVIRGVTNLLPVGREGVVILPAEREHRRVVVAGGEVARELRSIVARASRRRKLNRNDEDVAALARLVGVPMTVEEAIKDQRLELRVF